MKEARLKRILKDDTGSSGTSSLVTKLEHKIFELTELDLTPGIWVKFTPDFYKLFDQFFAQDLFFLILRVEIGIYYYRNKDVEKDKRNQNQKGIEVSAKYPVSSTAHSLEASVGVVLVSGASMHSILSPFIY